jgi:7-carboxy-7-deazaguanine synthase
MTYSVKEIFYTLQGDGSHAGRPAVFCRFAGCNLWTGREQDRASAVCKFCDTDFVGTDGTLGGKFAQAHDLAARIASLWPEGGAGRFVVLTGGEPLLQVDVPLIDALHAQGFEIAVETNGTVAAPPGIDWLCVSPKDLAELEALDFGHRRVQPMDGPQREANTEWAVQWCLQHPRWQLSLQTHKYLGIR